MHSSAKTLSLSWLSKIQNIITNFSKIKVIAIVIQLKNSSHQKKKKAKKKKKL